MTVAGENALLLGLGADGIELQEQRGLPLALPRR